MERKLTLLMMKGLPLSGKTEWAEKWVAKGRNRVRVSWTDIMRSCGRKSRDRRLLAFETATHLMVQALKRGCDVVLDECNLNPTTFSIFMARASMLGARVEWHNMDVSLDEVKRRNARLGHPVDDMELERLVHDHGIWLKQK